MYTYGYMQGISTQFFFIFYFFILLCVLCVYVQGNPPDLASLAILDANVKDETGHVAYAVKWFKFICQQRALGEPIEVFHRYTTPYYIIYIYIIYIYIYIYVYILNLYCMYTYIYCIYIYISTVCFTALLAGTCVVYFGGAFARPSTTRS